MVADQFSRPTLAELDDPVDGANEDTEGGEGECGEERLERPASAQFSVRRVERPLASQCPHPRDRADCEVKRKTDEDEEREDLERETRDEDMVAEVGGLVLVAGGGGDSTAGSL